MRIGAHVGVGKGWVAAVEYGADVGAECLQVFSKSPRMWRTAPLPDDSGEPFAQARRAAGIDPVYVHTSYLINLGSDDDALWERSVAALATEFERAAAVGAAGLVTHVGTDPFGDPPRAAAHIARAITRARKSAARGHDIALLLENAAGAGRSYGGDLRDLGRLLCEVESLDAGPVGICFDSCHAFAAGYDLRDSGGWHAALGELADACGRRALGLVHANDCMFELGERRDRHAWIGEGAIGVDGFAAMMAVPELADVPTVLEMPGDPPEKDRLNIERLKDLRRATDGS